MRFFNSIYNKETFMKKKNKNAIIRKKKEFRFHKIELISSNNKNSIGWHPAYVFLEKGNVFIYVSLTHSNSIKNGIVIKLKKNPNPKDNRDSFYVCEVKEDTKDRFRRRREGWSMDAEDDNAIRDLFMKKR